MPSPVVLMSRPWFLAIAGSISSSAVRLEARERARLVDFHQPAVADHVGGEDGCEAAFDCGAAHDDNVASGRGDDKRAETMTASRTRSGVLEPDLAGSGARHLAPGSHHRDRPWPDARQAGGDPKRKALPIFELSWNHTTLHALRIDPTVTYLQVLYPPPDHMRRALHMHERFGDEVMAHLEFVRFDGQIACLGLPIVRFSTEERLDEIIRHHEDDGCPIFNPHAFTLEEGGMKQVDRTHLAFKREADPRGPAQPRQDARLG